MSSQGIDNNIAGRLALVTGASGGIGGASARSLYLQHVNLALSYNSNVDSVNQLASKLQEEYKQAYPDRTPPRISTHQADLSDTEATIQLSEKAKSEHSQAVDILIANAGFGKRITDIEEIPLDLFQHTLNVNLQAPFLLAKSVVGHMKQQRWGRIIFVSSIAGYGVGLNGCHYAASKGGLTAMMKNLSTRLAEYNITVNDVSPAMIGETGLIPSGDSVPGLAESIPLKRLGVPSEVANVVSMFCTTGYMTGQSVLLAGGLNHK
ncbi:3-ketoacyl-acyl carrier protein reductase [Aaosphaeria arxii CBS 175.79]|uniref:3-ketoacyl-acyl carrier protein reductase n=1 Tax=Aaosphaeria arxii CBS 175.79 TaxID=1450172 RepID=A0A6A5Y2T0_9PLEO|nr:3-ketoacyl-acyl carrier protein reductase [Aaosphaeria arxii CBS 175.79]KAF2019768.1 3-ketoacyl-acyl carrier protein reductase [Aaosphaeria arxii CBS 175.79]